jgi:outer membrane protein TolC
MHLRRKFSLRLACVFLVMGSWASPRGLSQCAGVATTPAAAAGCAARALPENRAATIDPSRAYTLAELIDIAERSNPRTRILWERAKQRAEALGVEKSAYYPVLAGVAAFGDQRTIEPFPKPLAPRGYTMVEVPIVQPEITLQYLIFDFGNREGRVDAAAAQKLAAGANFIAANQQVAFRVASAYYGLLTAQEQLEAARETLKTAQTTQDAAEDRLNNGRATLPDVLNARAETSQSDFDLESADGDEKIARVTLTEAVGAEPSPHIQIDGKKDTPLPHELTLSIDALIDRAMANRPDLQAQASEIRAAEDTIRQAKAAYRPQISLMGSAAQTTVWPTADYGQLGFASEPTWSAALGIEWRLWEYASNDAEYEVLAESSKASAACSFLTAVRKAMYAVHTSRVVWSRSSVISSLASRRLDSAIASSFFRAPPKQLERLSSSPRRRSLHRPSKR